MWKGPKSFTHLPYFLSYQTLGTDVDMNIHGSIQISGPLRDHAK